MVLARLLFVILTGALLGGSAAAQAAPCSSALPDPPIFALVLSSPVRLSFRQTVQAILSEPSVTIAGNEITVTQTQFLTAAVVPPTCNSQSVALGDLSPGPYRFNWVYQSLSQVPVSTLSFGFTVVPLGACVLDISVQPESPVAGQTVSILYSAPYRGFLQTPSVVIDGGQITIDQPAVIADPVNQSFVPCGRGVVQIGGLQAGVYTAAVGSTFGAPLSATFLVRPGPRSRAVRGH
jgi:hypothetical protein